VATSPDVRHRLSWADATDVPFWLDRPDRPNPLPCLLGSDTADLVVVGGGYTGLWAALQAKEEDPSRDVLVLDVGTCGDAASGRNGGFCSASLTHGLSNGIDRFPAEITRLEELGRENLDEIEATLARHDISCAFERTGELDVAVEPWHVSAMRELAREAADYGFGMELLSRDEIRAQVNSPLYLGGVWERDRVAMVDPAQLVWGLRAACLRLGVRIMEGTRVLDLVSGGGPTSAVRVVAATGSVDARKVVVATNAGPSPLKRLGHYIAPVHDYALVSEPLSHAQMNEIGWRGRQGIGDAGNQFHYYRLTEDNRILFGGYDAVYSFGGRSDPRPDQAAVTFDLLTSHFFTTFPQLEGVRFTHAWGGAIDTCTRFCVFWGTAFEGRVAYAVGYTGLGVGASRFGARVALDLLAGGSDLTELDFVRSKPLPFPPEPFRYAGIQATRWSLAQADRQGGQRNLWLRTLDRLGLGFDS
jgi:glycine/D-amino acid oxidase-like deaminating enzyme